MSGQELIWVSADEVIAGDRVAVPGFGLWTVVSVEPNLDVPGNLLIQCDRGTYEEAYDKDVQIAPNPALGECDQMPTGPTVAKSDDAGPVSHVRQS